MEKRNKQEVITQLLKDIAGGTKDVQLKSMGNLIICSAEKFLSFQTFILAVIKFAELAPEQDYTKEEVLLEINSYLKDFKDQVEKEHEKREFLRKQALNN